MPNFHYHSGSYPAEDAPTGPVRRPRGALPEAAAAAVPAAPAGAVPRPRAAAGDGLAAALVPPGAGVFRVHLRTESYRPGHAVTIRNAADGWERDLLGTYRDGAWVFELDSGRYPQGLEMKFVLDGTTWMEGFNLHLAPHQDHHLDESAVVFRGHRPRYRHGYDNLRTEEHHLQQDRLRSRLTDDVLYDVVVVGSGIGGGILADALSDLGLETLVLDAGSLIYQSHITNLPGDWPALPGYHQVGHFANQPGSKLLGGVQMNMGGRSVFWSGLIPRMRDWELSRWPQNIAADLKASGYDAAEAVMRKQRTLGPFQDATVAKLRARFPDHDVRNLPRSLHQPEIGSGSQLVNVLEKSTGVFSTADLLLDSLAYAGMAGRDNLTINLNHLVTHVETDGNRRATAVVCRDLVGDVERRFRGRHFVLACGSLESPRIVLRSGLRDPSGKAGRGLTDHPAFFWTSAPLAPGSEFGGLEDHAKVLMAHERATPTDHAYNVEVLINPKYWDARHPDDGVRRQRIDSIGHSKVEMKFIFSSLLDDDNHIVDHGPWAKASVKVKPNLTGSDKWPEVRDLRNELAAFLGAPVQDPNAHMHFGNEGTVHHAGGSLRMSGNNTGVVDTDLRFEAYDNLFACDVSVFPFIPAANPALTLGALSLRLAEHLRSLV